MTDRIVWRHGLKRGKKREKVGQFSGGRRRKKILQEAKKSKLNSVFTNVGEGGKEIPFPHREHTTFPRALYIGQKGGKPIISPKGRFF